MIKPDDIAGYHAHIYFDQETLQKAKILCEKARDQFGLQMGRMHEKPVGPHPMWSCQLTLLPDQFGEVIPWLNIARDGLTVFVHPLTGNDLYDHRDAPMWLGASVPLKLEMFLKEPVV